MAASTANTASAADSPKAKLPAPAYRLMGSFAGNAADAVSFHIWDCAGQPVFNALHSLFMSGRVCEVRVLGAETVLEDTLSLCHFRTVAFCSPSPTHFDALSCRTV